MQLTTTEAAARLKIDKRSVVRAINRGKLRAAKRGRDYLIEPSEVERYAREHQRSAPSSAHTGTPADDVTQTETAAKGA